MCEVLKSNFEEIYPEIEDAIKSSSFIAIDLEFTGLDFEDGCNNNLFDGGAERYSKLRKNCQNFTISQIGLAVFRYDTTSNCYTAHVFNVYVFPQSCPSLDERFSCQASSLKFLCQYEFDFNKFIYDGVPYLTHAQEEKLRALGNPEELFSTLGENFFRPIFTSVSIWLRQAAVDDEMVIDSNRGVDILILQAKLCTMFKEVWTRSTSKNEVIVMKVSIEKRRLLENTSPAWKSRVIDSLVGFSKVFRLICDSKKPVIGHNMLMDLLLMYDKFHNKLPNSWTDLKNELHRILPNIYDTKHLASKCRKILEGYNLATQTNITDLFELLQSEKGQLAAFNSPTISLDPKSKHYGEKKHYHEAGYDAYICGYVFLRLCHLLAASKMIMGMKPLRLIDYIHIVQPYKNNVNMMRANLMFVKIDGEDPKSHRPDWLYVVARGNNTLPQAEELARKFGELESVDVQVIDKRTAVLAVSTFYGSKHILKAFRHDKTMSITRYSWLQHCKPVRYGLWCSIIAMGAFCVWTFVGDK